MQPAEAEADDGADPAAWAEGQLDPNKAAPNSPQAASNASPGPSEEGDTSTEDIAEDKTGEAEGMDTTDAGAQEKAQPSAQPGTRR